MNSGLKMLYYNEVALGLEVGKYRKGTRENMKRGLKMLKEREKFDPCVEDAVLIRDCLWSEVNLSAKILFGFVRKTNPKVEWPSIKKIL